MIHLKIEQSTSGRENVSSNVIEKLYNIVLQSELDSRSNLQGWIHADVSYGEYKTYLETLYPNLTIDLDSTAIYFQDPEVRKVLEGTYGYITDNNKNTVFYKRAATIPQYGYTIDTYTFNSYSYSENLDTTKIPFGGNTNIVHFDDFNQIPINILGPCEFEGCTNLQSINLQNIILMFRSGGLNVHKQFKNCSSLETFYAPNFLFGFCAGGSDDSMFYGCTNLKHIICPNWLHTQIANDFQPTQNMWDYPAQLAYWDLPNLEVIIFKKGIINLNTGDYYHSGAFSNLPKLRYVDVGENVAKLGEYTFKNTPNLETLVIRSSTVVPILKQNANSTTYQTQSFIFGGSTNINVYVPQALISQYQAADYWSTFDPNIFKSIENDLDEFDYSNL